MARSIPACAENTRTVGSCSVNTRRVISARYIRPRRDSRPCRLVELGRRSRVAEVWFRMGRVLAAVAWPYANGPRHIGHVAGFGVPSDVFSRYMRMAGHDVLMVSGTDEHGTPILVAADKEGVSARDLADKNNAVIVQDLLDLGLSYDLFTRTTTGNHYRVVQEMFET